LASFSNRQKRLQQNRRYAVDIHNNDFRTYFLEKIIIPIAVFVVTTADPPEKIELVQQDIFEHLVGGCLSVGSRLSKSNIVAIHHF
jgi:hypothetical protein